MNNTTASILAPGFTASLLLLSSLQGACGNNPEKPLPNVIVILADDIGYADFGCYGATRIKTPAVDRLAAEGVRFTQAYAPASTSSPSRYALLTGEYAWRKNVGILPADAPLAIDPTISTLPGLFRTAGYKTGIVGKWHLGLGEKGNPVDFNQEIRQGPTAIGFDYAYYFPATNDRVLSVYIENERVVNVTKEDPISVSYKQKVGNDPTGKENPEQLTMLPHTGHDGTIVSGVSRIGWMSGGKAARWDDEKMADHLLDKTISFIRGNARQPFLLYYAPHDAHEPRIPSPAFRGKSEAGIYGDVIEQFDYCVAKIIETLKEKGIYENTILIISSDNGPMIKEGYVDGALENINGHDPYGNLRGEKYSLYEGGTRVPFIFSWPEKIKQPFLQEQPYIYLDLFATLARLAGIDSPQQTFNDSRDGSALFLQKEAPVYREYIMIQNNGGQIALRKNDWKYIPATQTRRAELYNLRKDPSELHNMMISCPEIARELLLYVKEDYLIHKEK
ncbi:arylsulfatase [Parabacteroides sp. OttesenSCG-928-K15]|nr:arylsulfatase [Parabacteroides sp. OttesenSCG-928-K15]